MKKILLGLISVFAFNTLSADILTDTCRFKKDSENILTTKFNTIFESVQDTNEALTYEASLSRTQAIMKVCIQSFNYLGYQTNTTLKTSSSQLTVTGESYCIQYYNFMEYINNNIKDIEKREKIKLAYMIFTNRLHTKEYKEISNLDNEEDIKGYAFAYNFKKEFNNKSPLNYVNLPALNFSSYILKRDKTELNLGSQDALYSKYTTAILTGDFNTAIKILLNESDYESFIDSFKNLCKKIENKKEENIKEYTGTEVKDLLLQNKNLVNYYVNYTNNTKCYNSKNKLEVENNEDFISKFFTNFDNTTQAVLLKDIYTKQEYIEIMYNNNIYKFYEDKKLCETQKNR
ncbi:hypothetical protein [Aliarcobacter butzleri]|uniref:hypothetical protein n=1 Tax=Aliarcobacter butzleri TaxID=28197 RepID=UPI0021B4A845|nr:hypothetical protein [Aliarcobacter butzleri]MCT7596094.1 hypothetical protein [Aliarcobacter butzleri]